MLLILQKPPSLPHICNLFFSLDYININIRLMFCQFVFYNFFYNYELIILSKSRLIILIR